MDEASIKRQREIGKQLFLVNMVHCENDIGRKGGYSFLSRDDVATWASMTREEIDHFIAVCSTLDPYGIASEAARECCKETTFKSEKNAYCFVFSTYYRMGDLFSGFVKPDNFGVVCKGLSESNYQTYCEKHKNYPVDESYATSEVFEEAMTFYIKYYVEVIKEVVSEGYDWDVITAMTRTNISEERYHSLANAFVELRPKKA